MRSLNLTHARREVSKCASAHSDARFVKIRAPELCTFGRPNCAHSDARSVHIRTPDLCTFGRPNLCQQGCVLSRRSHCHGPQHWFCRVRCLRKKYRFYSYRARCCPPLPPEWVKVELDFPWPNLSEIKYRFCRRKCPFDGSTTLTLWGKGRQHLRA